VIWQHPTWKKACACCRKTTKDNCIVGPTLSEIFFTADPDLNSNQKKSPPTGSESDLRVGIKNPLPCWRWVLLLRTACRERIVGLSYCLQLQLLGLYAVAVHAVTLAATTHTCNLCYCPPLVWEADTQVRYLKYCTQAELTHLVLVMVHELYHIQLGFIAQVIAV